MGIAAIENLEAEAESLSDRRILGQVVQRKVHTPEVGSHLHIGDHAIVENERVLFLRRWLSREQGEKPSPVQAAFWLAIKRTYRGFSGPEHRRDLLTSELLAQVKETRVITR